MTGAGTPEAQLAAAPAAAPWEGGPVTIASELVRRDKRKALAIARRILQLAGAH